MIYERSILITSHYNFYIILRMKKQAWDRKKIVNSQYVAKMPSSKFGVQQGSTYSLGYTGSILNTVVQFFPNHQWIELNRIPGIIIGIMLLKGHRNGDYKIIELGNEIRSVKTLYNVIIIDTCSLILKQLIIDMVALGFTHTNYRMYISEKL